MNICLISYELPPSGGGEATYTYNLARGLNDRGHNVVIVVPKAVAKLASEKLDLGRIRLEGVDILERPLARVVSFMTRFARDMPKISERHKIDLAHFTFDYPSIPLKLGFDTPIISTLHHLHYVEALSMIRSNENIIKQIPHMLQQMFLSFSERTLMNQSRAVIAVSKFTYDTAIKYIGARSSNMFIVPNSIDTDLYARGSGVEEFLETYNISSERIILYVGRVEKSKGLEYLIRGFASVCSRFQSANLVIVGAGDAAYVAKLQDEARIARVNHKITFTGKIEQSLLLQAYRSAEIVVLPSLMEGFGLTVLEAMTVGKPVVATRVGAIPEIVEHKQSGILV